MERYEGVVAAAMKGENALWEIGDELVRILGTGRAANFGEKYKEISAVLVEHGIEQYKPVTLAEIRTTAIAFQDKHRVKGLSFTAHKRAGSPQVLEAVIAYAKEIGRPVKEISTRLIEDFTRKETKEDRSARSAARKDVLEAKREAERDAAKAADDKRKANDPDTRAEAARRQRDAEERAREAEILAEQLKGPPAVNHSAPKKGPADTPMLVVRTTFSSDLFKAKALAAKMAKDIEPHLDDLPDSFVNASVEDLLELSNAFRQLSNMIRSGKVNKRAHLYAVGE